MSPDRVFGPGAEPARLTDVPYYIVSTQITVNGRASFNADIVGEPPVPQQKEKVDRCEVRFNFVGGAKAYSSFLTNKQTGYARPTDQRTAVSDIPTLGHPVVAVKPEVCPTSGLHFLCEALDVPHPLPCAGCTV